jgi:tetratricopeptide (TPR) repeat protein
MSPCARVLGGRYRLDALLGEGGMGEVHVGFDLALERKVAVKVVRDTTGTPRDRAEWVARAQREARAAAALQHPNVVAIFDVGEEDGWPYLVLEYLEGQPLSHFVGVATPASDRIRWLRDAALGLSAAHEAGLVHRDLKPDNVFVCANGIVKVLDFGIARRADAQPGDTKLTTPGMAIGTPAYMSPEQVRGEIVDALSDQFSWGVTAYELLTGGLPWTNIASAYAAAASVLSEEPSPPSLRSVSIDPRLDAIVLRAMHKDKLERFASMSEVAAALDAALAPPVISMMPTAPQSVREAATRAVTDPPYPKAKVGALDAYRAAMGHFRDSNWPAAHRELARAVEIEPTFAAALLRLSITGRFDGDMTPEGYRGAFRRSLDRRRDLSPHDRAIQRAFEPLLLLDPASPADNIARLREACEAHPGDAEILGLTAALMLFDDPREQLGYAERAAAVDPEFAAAWVLSAVAHADLGAEDEALRDLDRALDLSPASADTYLERAALHAVRGDAARAEADARQAVALDENRYGLEIQVAAMVAGGRPREAVRDVLRRKWALVDERMLPSIRAYDEAQLAILEGSLAQAAEIVAHAERAGADERSIDYHGPLARVAIECALELGDVETAGAAAQRWVERSVHWTAASTLSRDATAHAIAALERSGSLTGQAADERREAWASTFWAPTGVVWAASVAPALDLPRVRDAARQRSQRDLVFRAHNWPDQRAAVGRTLLALGRLDEAASWLRASARGCLWTFDAMSRVHATLWLGETLEALGDRAAAAEAYERVVSLWRQRAPDAASVVAARAGVARTSRRD